MVVVVDQQLLEVDNADRHRSKILCVWVVVLVLFEDVFAALEHAVKVNLLRVYDIFDVFLTTLREFSLSSEVSSPLAEGY